MAKQFNELRERLLRAGVAPRHVARYLRELSDHLADLIAEEERGGRSRADAESAAMRRLGAMEDLCRAMTEQRRLRSWSARAPWAVFGGGSLLVLAAAYFVACAYLWFLWQVFLPGADTPFGQRNAGPIYGWQNICFQAGKYFYIAAPVLVGWGMAWVGARQRVRAVWLAGGLALIAWMGSTAHIQASRTAVPGGLGHIRMDFFAPGQNLAGMLVTFAIVAMPYVIWRWRRAESLS
ncbi:MAG TPA: hypothetical protein VFW25_01205 [Silvibacterium sp.]|nr:hypothetical protein [Silvibacterium sp.]